MDNLLLLFHLLSFFSYLLMKQELKTANEENRIQAKAQTKKKKNYKNPLTQNHCYFRLIFHLIGAATIYLQVLILSDKWKFL